MSSETKSESSGFLKTTAIGGVLFLFPVVVLGALLGYVYNIVSQVYEPLKKILPVDTPLGFFLLFLAAIGIVLALCFFCGLMTKRAIARRFSQTIEKQLMMVFPKYAIYKDLLAGNIGGAENAPTLIPVTVKLNDLRRIAFESDRLADGQVVIYLPGAPDTWDGSVAIVSAEQVEPLEMRLPDVVAIFERLGRETAQLPLRGNRAADVTSPP